MLPNNTIQYSTVHYSTAAATGDDLYFTMVHTCSYVCTYACVCACCAIRNKLLDLRLTDSQSLLLTLCSAPVTDLTDATGLGLGPAVHDHALRPQIPQDVQRLPVAVVMTPVQRGEMEMQLDISVYACMHVYE